jgi:hypothetical protein
MKDDKIIEMLFERNEEAAKARYEHLLKLVEMYKD